MMEKTVCRLSASDREWIAQKVNGEILRVAREIRASDRTAKRVAEQLGCIIEEFNAGRDVLPNGYYVPATQFGDPSIIMLNKQSSKRTRHKMLLHEIAHHLMVVWVPRMLYGVDTVVCYEGDNGEVRHKIARRVEQLVCD